MQLSNISSSSPPYILYATSYYGYNEYVDRQELKTFTGVDPVTTEWCAAFINAVLSLSGISGSDSVSDHPLTARSFLTLGKGVDNPNLGDIIVLRRGTSDWQGHVGFYIKTTTQNDVEYYMILGGNQNNSVSISAYPVSKVLGIRRISQ